MRPPLRHKSLLKGLRHSSLPYRYAWMPRRRACGLGQSSRVWRRRLLHLTGRFGYFLSQTTRGRPLGSMDWLPAAPRGATQDIVHRGAGRLVARRPRLARERGVQHADEPKRPDPARYAAMRGKDRRRGSRLSGGAAAARVVPV